MELLQPKVIAKLDPDVHSGFTEWINAIKAAILESVESFKDDATKIQVRRMTSDDLTLGIDCELPLAEHDFDRVLYVVKLPVPNDFHSLAPNILFIRPDDYELFNCVLETRRSILTGNPGISKSWFQWKFILLCYRQDLYKLLQMKPVATSEEEEPEAKKLKVDDKSEENKKIIPELVVRTIGGRKSFLFFVNRDTNVIFFCHVAEQLDLFTDKNTTILWEPGTGTDPVEYVGIESRIIATVSPNLDRFHEFENVAEMFYMPCPSELQLRLMGQVYRNNGESTCPSDNEVCNRIRQCGPFTRVVLCWSESKILDFKRYRKMEIRRIRKSDFLEILTSTTHIMEESNIISGTSHRLARYDVNRNSAIQYGGYTRPQYRLSCVEVLRKINKKSIR